MSLIFEPDHLDHWCVDELATVESTRPPWLGPVAGSVARCTCGRYYVVDERTGRWRRIGRHSRVVREALAHQEERRSR